MGRKTTKFPAGVDSPLVQDANFKFDPNDRAYLDDQIRSVQAYALANPGGVNAFTTTIAPFTMPAVSSTVTANFGTTSWLAVGQTLFIETAGYMAVTAIVDGTHATISNNGSTANATPSTVIASGSKVSPGGVPGTGGGGGATTVTVDPGGGNIPSGYGYVRKPGTSYVVVANTANRAAAGGAIDGVTPATQAAGSTFTPPSTITSAISGLGTSSASSPITCDANGKLIRTTNFGQSLIGLAATTGDCIIYETPSTGGRGPSTVLNAILYGAIPNDSGSTARAANSAAAAAMDASAAGFYTQKIIWPAAKWYFAANSSASGADYRVSNSCYLEGECGNTGGYNTQLIFPGTRTGLRIDAASQVRHIDIVAESIASWTEWVADTSYALGAKVRPPTGDWAYIYECTTAGYSSATSYPVGMDAPILDGDGTLGYTALVESLTAGQIAASKTPAKWAVRHLNGILATHQVHLEHVSTYNTTAGPGWTCFGKLLYGNDETTFYTNQYSDVNSSTVYHCSDFGSAGHVQLRGSNANNISVRDCWAWNSGYGQNGNVHRGGSHRDEGLAGNLWEVCYTQNAQGYGGNMDFRSAGGQPVAINCQCESYGDRYSSDGLGTGSCNAIVIGGTQGKAPVFDAGVVVHGGGGNRTGQGTSFDRKNKKNIAIRPTYQDGFGSGSFYAFTSDDEGRDSGYVPISFFATQYNSVDPGWYVKRFTSTINPLTWWRQIEGVSGSIAPEGAGHKWIRHGFFVGSPKLYRGFEPNDYTDRQIRGGLRLAGERYAISTSPAAGDWATRIVRTQGYRGPAWPGTVSGLDTPHVWNRGEKGSVICPVNNGATKAYQLAQYGALGGSEPVWSSFTTVGPAGVRIPLTSPSPVEYVAEGELFIPPTRTGWIYIVDTPTPFSAGATVVPLQYVGPSTPNGYQFVVDILGFQSGPIQKGRLVRPSDTWIAANPGVPYYAWKVTSTTNTSVTQGSLGTEPTWPASPTYGVTTVTSGDCTLTCVRLQLPATEPTSWDASGATWLMPQNGTSERVPLKWVQLYTGAPSVAPSAVAWPTVDNGRVKWGTAWFRAVPLATMSEPASGYRVTDGSALWVCVGTPDVADLRADMVEDSVIAYEPRAKTRWGGGGAAVVTNCVIESTRNYLPTTDATANQIVETYTVPANSAEIVDFQIVAKQVGGLGSAGFLIKCGVERNGSGAAVLTYTPAPTLLYASGTLGGLTASSVSVAVSATTGAIDVRVTGLAAVNIHWNVVRQSLEST